MLNYLYLLLNLLSFLIPFAYSFEKRMNFISQWKAVVVSLAIVSSIFIFWDIIFTINGVWGFNPDYLLGINILHLPIEEWMFFLLIPYASFFIHYSLQYFFPKVQLSIKLTQIITILLIASSLVVALFNWDKAYTLVNYSFFSLILLIGIMKGKHLLQRFYVSYPIILIPFLLINGILTGSFIENEVVWYNDMENLGIRLFTIPIEDFAYAFSMIFLNVFLIEYWRKKLKLPALKTRI
ncbi:MAG: lycopene cyclase domain-containing protein [Flavobacteriales bacterium]|nr:lycopene cyclase domain-containing protein [Flavobacteriales bacterium]